MQVTDKDLETLKKVFETINKAKWDDLDGNAVISVYQSFVAFRALEDKMTRTYKEQQQALAIAKQEEAKQVSEVVSSPKKSKKKSEE